MLGKVLLDEAEFTAVLTSADIHAASLAVDAKGTLCSAPRGVAPGEGTGSSGSNSSSNSGAGDSGSSGSGSSSPSTASSGRRLALLTGGDAPELVVKGKLSAGGMGDVVLAHQGTLGRDVAVKMPKASAPRERDVDIVVEGRVIGQLEHPNIVPVHALGRSADDRPLLVMKRIEGQTWRDAIKEGRDLNRDLGIAIELCQALSFAHARGVAHCDIKPANVMVGSFGEVYLVDWGIAVGFGACSVDGVPHASTIKGVFGTPKYMAPEMALPHGGIDARTDIYILGAVLFEVITGRPLRQGRKTAELLHEAHIGAAPTFGGEDRVDEELAAIVTTALQRDPALRFQSADALKLALAAYLRHGSLRVLVERSVAMLAELKTSASAADSDELHTRHLAAGCRFGFQTALDAWPESAVAKDGLLAALTILADYELDRGELAAARSLVADLASVDVDEVTLKRLIARGEGLEAETQRKREAADAAVRFAEEHSQHTAARERAITVMVAAVSWLGTTIALDRLEAANIYVAGPGTFSVFTGLFALVFAIAGLTVPQLRATHASRASITMMTATELGLSVVYGLCALYGVGVPLTLAIGQMMLTTTAAHFAANDKKLWPATGILGLSIVPGLLWPEHAIVINGVGCFIALSDLARRWRHFGRSSP
jgi:serine/threonine-protein kinase